MFDGRPHERVVEPFGLFGAIDIAILVGPVFVFPPFRFLRMVPLVRMIGAVILHQIRGIGGEQAGSLPVH